MRIPPHVARGQFTVPKPIPGPGRAFVYIAYGADDEVLYVGLTENLLARIGGHARGFQSWLEETERIEWRQYRSRDRAAEAELRLIVTLEPKYNGTFNNKQRARDEPLPPVRASAAYTKRPFQVS